MRGKGLKKPETQKMARDCRNSKKWAERNNKKQ
jgi:hypothetical protein